MNSKIIAFGIILFLFFGCTGGKPEQVKAGPGQSTPSKTCAELNGFICNRGECKGTVLDSTETRIVSGEECCSIQCTAVNADAKNEWDNAEMPSFDFGNYNDSMGDLNA